MPLNIDRSRCNRSLQGCCCPIHHASDNADLYVQSQFQSLMIDRSRPDNSFKSNSICGGKLAGEIAQALTLPGATLSFHLKELAGAGLVTSEQRGRTVCYRANFDVMASLVDYLPENCCAGDKPCGTPAGYLEFHAHISSFRLGEVPRAPTARLGTSLCMKRRSCA